MKLSCLPVSLYPDLRAGRLALSEWFRMAADLGLDGADLSVAHVASRAPEVLGQLRQDACDAGIELSMLVTYSDFTHPDPAYRRGQVDEVRHWIDAAARLRVRFLRLTAGQAHAGVSEADGLQWATDGLTACLDVAQAAGVRLLYENHTKGSIWDYNDFTQPADRFLEVVRRTASTELGILFDTANCLALNDDPPAVLDAVIDRVGAVHLSDIRQCGTFEPTTIGTGVAPLRALLRQLVASGYDGWINIEEASRTGVEGFRKAVAFVDAVWVEVGGRGRDTRQLPTANSQLPSCEL
jgi:sugar phosphate isomerase/epimerase